MDRFQTIGVIQNKPYFDENKLDDFMNRIETLRRGVLGVKMIL